MAPRDGEWRLIAEESWDGPTNMALDEVAAETAAHGGPRTLRVYRWDPATLSLGYRQAPATVDWEFCRREGVTVTRRPTGGGGIYHDSYGDVSFSIVAPADELPGDLMASYELLCEPLLDALGRLGVPADFAEREQPALHEPSCYLRGVHPAHDVVVEDGSTDGSPARKISGNAQYRRRDAVVQHGSLKYDRRPARHLATFADPGVTPAAFRERVTTVRETVDVSRARAVGALEDALREWAEADVGSWTPEEVERARSLAATKYATAGWTRERAEPSG